jgi:hypothetical protein
MYVLEGDFLMFQSDMDVDMLHVLEIISLYGP